MRLSIESYNCFLTAFGIFGKDDVVPILNEIKRHVALLLSLFLLTNKALPLEPESLQLALSSPS